MTARKTCAILKALYHSPCTYKEIVAYTGLNINTIRANLAILIEEGFVIGGRGDKSATGPAPLLFTLSSRWRSSQ